jgi:hypothetical protein
MSRLILSLALCFAALLPACTDTPLERNVDVEIPVYDNKLKLSGKFCTTDPSDVVFPLKVLFVIDTSQSMNVNDPISQTIADPLMQTGRSRAIRDVVMQYIDLKMKIATTYCNTGVAGCAKGSTKCTDCGAAGKFMCLGPDCCSGTVASCKGTPSCPTTTGTNKAYNATCIPLCDVTKAGCMPGEKACADCPNAGDKCLGGICGNHKDPGVEFAIMRFGSAKQVLTKNKDGLEGFTNDVKELVSSIPQVSNGGSVTDYEGALSMAYKVISKDIGLMKDKNAAAVARTKYVVVFLSDGAPYPPVNDEDDWDTVPCHVQGDLLGIALSDPNNCSNDPTLDTYRQSIQEYNVPGRILVRVKELTALKALHRLGDLKLHTAFLSGNSPSWVEDQATYLLKQMAQLGKGTFRSFPNGEAINFLHVGFSSLRRLFKLKNLVVSNINGRPVDSQTVADSDGDGLDDKVEKLAGSDVARLDSDNDGFSDTLEHFYRSSGWDSLDPSDADCPLLKDLDNDKLPDDTDGDGLLDCEERFLGTSRTLFDSDADGIPDAVEVKFGTNPVVVDIDDDLDFDGMPNGDEIRLHTDPRSDDAAHRSRTSYRYKVEREGTGIEQVGLRCTLDADCPRQVSCKEGYCRCGGGGNADCSTGANCKVDQDCTATGETCDAKGKCEGSYACGTAITGVTDTTKMCTAKKHITCYSYEVENIALVTPRQSIQETKKGWNNVYLYFGEAPFDNPTDYGIFKMACVRAWYNDQDGSKQPATGKVLVPMTAWKDPKEFSKTYVATGTAAKTGAMECGVDAASAKLYCLPGDACLDTGRNRCRVSGCVCPDGKVGLCR